MPGGIIHVAAGGQNSIVSPAECMPGGIGRARREVPHREAMVPFERTLLSIDVCTVVIPASDSARFVDTMTIYNVNSLMLARLSPQTDKACLTPLPGASLPGTSYPSQPRTFTQETTFGNLAQL